MYFPSWTMGRRWFSIWRLYQGQRSKDQYGLTLHMSNVMLIYKYNKKLLLCIVSEQWSKQNCWLAWHYETVDMYDFQTMVQTDFQAEGQTVQKIEHCTGPKLSWFTWKKINPTVHKAHHTLISPENMKPSPFIAYEEWPDKFSRWRS